MQIFLYPEDDRALKELRVDLQPPLHHLAVVLHKVGVMRCAGRGRFVLPVGSYPSLRILNFMAVGSKKGARNEPAGRLLGKPAGALHGVGNSE